MSVSGIMRMNIAGMATDDLRNVRRALEPCRSEECLELWQAVQDELDSRADNKYSVKLDRDSE